MNISRKNIVICIAATMIISACASPVEKFNKEIRSMEESLYSDTLMTTDIEKSMKMIDKYVAFAEKFPSDSSSPVYLFRAADLSAKSNEITNAVQLFEKMRNDYPEHRNAPFALFLQGFIYENQAGDPMKAKPYYEEFLSVYPDHPIAGDVAFSLENLGKTPEELIREFEMKAETNEDLSSESNSVN